MLIEQLKSTQFTEENNDLREIVNRITQKIENPQTYDYFSSQDYEKLVNYYLNENDEARLGIMLSASMVNLLKLETGKLVFEEDKKAKKLFDIQYKILIKSTKTDEM